jgi:hypothetical protein
MDLIAATKLAVMIVRIFFSLSRLFSMLSARVFPIANARHWYPIASVRPQAFGHKCQATCGALFTFHFSGEA